MKRAYKYRLNPTPEQIVFFNKSFGCCRFVYNYMLGKRIEAYQRDKTKIGWVELAKMLTELKKEDGKEWLSEVSNECLQGRHNDRDILASVNIKRFGLISPLVEGVEDVEWSAVVGAVKRQYVRV